MESHLHSEKEILETNMQFRRRRGYEREMSTRFFLYKNRVYKNVKLRFAKNIRTF